MVLYQISSVGNLFQVLCTYIAHIYTALSLIKRVFTPNLPWFSPFGINDFNIGLDYIWNDYKQKITLDSEFNLTIWWFLLYGSSDVVKHPKQCETNNIRKWNILSIILTFGHNFILVYICMSMWISVWVLLDGLSIWICSIIYRGMCKMRWMGENSQ